MPDHRHIRIPVLGKAAPPIGSDFVSLEAASGIVLLLAAIGALIWANTDTAGYTSWWGHELTVGWGELTILYEAGIEPTLAGVALGLLTPRSPAAGSRCSSNSNSGSTRCPASSSSHCSRWPTPV